MLGLMVFFSGPIKTTFEYFLGFAFRQTITPQDLKSKYQTNSLKILVVPGHDNEYPGAEYGGLREADLTLSTAKALVGLFKGDPHFQVFTTRNFTTGRYTEEFGRYFVSEKAAIEKFRADSSKLMHSLIVNNVAEDKSTPYHGFASSEVSERLYGINKWANDHGIDIVIHLHFNNYPRANDSSPGAYNGFAMYIPEPQFPNAVASNDLARSVFKVLKNNFSVSNFPPEAQGVVADQDLIAVGSNASLDKAAFLIEYGYIYEAQFRNAAVRAKILPELAYFTFVGLTRYFESTPGTDQNGRFETTLLPYEWKRPLTQGLRGDPDVLSLQTALHIEGVYPPSGKTLGQCPINGNFGPCVASALEFFQKKYNLREALGSFGAATRDTLNGLYGQTLVRSK